MSDVCNHLILHLSNIKQEQFSAGKSCMKMLCCPMNVDLFAYVTRRQRTRNPNVRAISVSSIRHSSDWPGCARRRKKGNGRCLCWTHTSEASNSLAFRSPPPTRRAEVKLESLEASWVLYVVSFGQATRREIVSGVSAIPGVRALAKYSREHLRYEAPVVTSQAVGRVTQIPKEIGDFFRNSLVAFGVV